MAQAAGRGIIDFSTLDPRGRRDQLRLKIILQELQHQNEIELYYMLHRQLSSQLSNSGLTSDSLKNVWESSTSIYDRVKNILFPWDKPEDDKETKSKNKYVGFKEAWAGAYGDPDDPLVQAQIEATARWLTDGSINS